MLIGKNFAAMRLLHSSQHSMGDVIGSRFSKDCKSYYESAMLTERFNELKNSKVLDDENSVNFQFISICVKNKMNKILMVSFKMRVHC